MTTEMRLISVSGRHWRPHEAGRGDHQRAGNPNLPDSITESPFCYMVLYILPWAERASPASRRSHGDPSCSTNTSRSDVFGSGTLSRTTGFLLPPRDVMPVPPGTVA